ncbi:MAG: translation initiation factor IF-2 N-terminal domain-containing protein, partial [Spirulinaceae cyanobacterium]
MNNGKTRIYELSKELNRENKDILEICKELNIEVKSHSSTVADEAVERIRAMVKRQGPKERRSPNRPRNEPLARPKGPRKPQIREILKSNLELEQNQGNGQSGAAESSTPASLTPPQPPAKPKLKVPTPPTA